MEKMKLTPILLTLALLIVMPVQAGYNDLICSHETVDPLFDHAPRDETRKAVDAVRPVAQAADETGIPAQLLGAGLEDRLDWIADPFPYGLPFYPCVKDPLEGNYRAAGAFVAEDGVVDLNASTALAVPCATDSASPLHVGLACFDPMDYDLDDWGLLICYVWDYHFSKNVGMAISLGEGAERKVLNHGTDWVYAHIPPTSSRDGHVIPATMAVHLFQSYTDVNSEDLTSKRAIGTYGDFWCTLYTYSSDGWDKGRDIYF